MATAGYFPKNQGSPLLSSALPRKSSECERLKNAAEYEIVRNPPILHHVKPPVDRHGYVPVGHILENRRSFGSVKISGSLPVSGNAPIDGEILLDCSVGVEGKLNIFGTLECKGVVPICGTIIVSTTIPIQTQELPLDDAQLTVRANIPLETRVPVTVNIPIAVCSCVPNNCTCNQQGSCACPTNCCCGCRTFSEALQRTKITTTVTATQITGTNTSA